MNAKARLRSLKLLKLHRLQNERIRYFEPHSGQKEFILQIDEGSFIVISAAGNGWGKTKVLIAIFAAIMWPELAPSCFATPFFQKFPYPKFARIYSTPKELEDIGSIQAAIKEYFPAGRYTFRKKGRSYPSEFKTDTGWTMDMFSYEQDSSEAAGPNIGLSGWNEPPPEPLWKEGLIRARAGGIHIGAMTSLLDQPWVVDGILNRHNGKDIRVRYGDVEENSHLTPAQVDKILDQYDPDEREARKTGRPLSLSGRILKSFDRSVHVAKEPIKPVAEGVAHYQVVDPAIGKPVFSLWAQVDHAGLLQIYDEWPDFSFFNAKDSGMTVGDYAKLFRSRESGFKIQERVLDRHFGNVRRTLGGKTLKQEFEEQGMTFDDSYHVAADLPEVETGILKIKEYLGYDKLKAMDSLNRPKLIISPTCKNLIAACERWGRDPKSGKPLDNEFKDPIDCLRYLVMAEPQIEQHREWGQTRPAHYGVGNG
jgi:hypothetical protein